jgi:hypothetical protein
MDLAELAELQDQVVSRRQLLELEMSPAEIRRLLRRRELVRVHAGVYVCHTGPLTEAQRLWVAVLACWPAALCRDSVLDGPGEGPVHVAVDHRRTVRAPAGVVVHRMARLDDRVRWNQSPPAVRFECSVIDVALDKPDVAAMYQVLAGALQSRRTTVEKLRAEVGSRTRVRDRQLLAALLDDLAEGACSVLERGYLALERAHGLPSSGPDVTRQRPVADGSRSRYQDVCYEAYGTTVELDGRAFHDNARARDDDAGRDLDNAVSTDGVTVRLTHGQVFRDGCATAAKIGRLLQRRGWTGQPTRCPDCADS